MKLTYTNVNGYLLPDLTYKSGKQMEQLGKYGFLRRDYLKNHRNCVICVCQYGNHTDQNVSSEEYVNYYFNDQMRV